MVTRPAPARSAPRAASRAAPVDHEGPEATTACPRSYLCPLNCGRGKCASQSCGVFSKAWGRMSANTLSAIPISATEMGPQKSRPGRSTWPGFLRKNVMVCEALTASPMTAPEVPLMPLGKSTATTGADCAFMPSIIARGRPSTGRSRPAPNKASMMTSAPARAAGSAGIVGPVQALAASAASPLSRPTSPTSRTSAG